MSHGGPGWDQWFSDWVWFLHRGSQVAATAKQPDRAEGPHCHPEVQGTCLACEKLEAAQGWLGASWPCGAAAWAGDRRMPSPVPKPVLSCLCCPCEPGCGDESCLGVPACAAIGLRTLRAGNLVVSPRLGVSLQQGSSSPTWPGTYLVFHCTPS